MIPCLFSPTNLSNPPSLLQRSLFFARTSFSPMASLALLKFWKPSTARVAAGYADSLSTAKASEVCEEEEDSFFELEFALPHDETKNDCKQDPTDQKIGRIGDFISHEEPDVRMTSKPQSPMSILLRSAPKLRIFMFGNLIKKSKPDKSSQMQKSSAGPAAGGGSAEAKRKTKNNFTVKLRIEEKKRFSRIDSSRINVSGGGDLDGSSGRFSKDSVQKYLNLIKKPLYVKLSSPSAKRESFDSANTAFSSPRKSEERANSNGRFRVPCKNLGKSRSAGALLGDASSAPAGWKDDTLAQQNDGIQGAILHCKQSFNSSPKERCMMSRCASDTSYQKSIQITE